MQQTIEQVKEQLFCQLTPQDRKFYLTEQERLALQEFDERERGFSDE